MLKLSKPVSIVGCVRLADQIEVEGFVFYAAKSIVNGKAEPAHFKVHCVGHAVTDAGGKVLDKPTYQGRWIEKIDPATLPGLNVYDVEGTKAALESHLAGKWVPPGVEVLK